MNRFIIYMITYDINNVFIHENKNFNYFNFEIIDLNLNLNWI